MRVEEARWMEQAISRHIPSAKDPGVSVALNLGCGTRNSREITKPYIDQLTLQPLRNKGYQIVHSDIMLDDGVDLVGDIFDEKFQEKLKVLRPQIVLFCNILEHLPKKLRLQVPKILEFVLADKGFLIVSVPNSYPYHADPIDTMYRPSTADLAQFFKNMNIVHSAIIESEGYMVEFSRMRAAKKAGKVLRMFFPFVRPKRWLSHAHRFTWLWRPYRITTAVFQVRTTARPDNS